MLNPSFRELLNGAAMNLLSVSMICAGQFEHRVQWATKNARVA